MPTDLRTRGSVLPLAVCLLAVLVVTALPYAEEEYVLVTKWGSGGDGEGEFSGAHGVAVGPSGNVYVFDRGNKRIQEFTPNGRFVRQWGSQGPGPGQFLYPMGGIAASPSGHVYATDADSSNPRVQKFTSKGIYRTEWGVRGENEGEFRVPCGVAVAPSGNVYVAALHRCCIQQFTPQGAFVREWGSPGGANGEFQSPYDVAVGPTGEVYVADSLNDRIQKFTSRGHFLAKWGSSGDDNGEFHSPIYIAVDAWGYVYVTETGNHRVQKFTADGQFLTKWGSRGDGDGEFNYPTGVAVDAAANVYVADGNNQCIQKFAPDTPKPDMRARLSRDDPWSFNDQYGPARTQKLAANVRAGDKQLFHLSLQNDSKKDRSYYVHGTGPLSGGWSIKYSTRVAGKLTDITDAITGPGGWDVGPLEAGRQQVFYAEIETPDTATGGSSRRALVEALPPDEGCHDAVALVLRVRKIRCPDARIKLPSENRWTGNNVYDADGKGQISRRRVPSEGRAMYHLSIQNDGNASDSFKITGSGSNPRWRVRYFTALSGGTNVTQEVTGGGWTTPPLSPGNSHEMLLSVAPKTDFEGDRKIVRVTATSTGNSTKQDAVKAITIVESTSAAACQVTSLSAVPTRAGAQLTFALSSDARVTATVLNVAGRPIKTILADKPLAAGVQTLVWNRTDNAGLAVPHGTYLVRVTARDRAGGEASALGSLVLR